ncbi:MAG TPA: DUF1385 domain-containing protein [Gaiellaceae bacterium]
MRLGGMALANGVLVHGPTAWACAVRTDAGEIVVAARRKRLAAARVTNPLLRGPARLAEAMALLPQVKRALPAAKLPFERPAVLAAMVAATAAGKSLRHSRLRPAVQELLGGALSLGPAVLALRGGELAGYHGAEHVSIGTYEHGEERPKEHERCGSHLIGPMLLTTAAGNAATHRLPPRLRATGRAVAAVGSAVASTELFGWMNRHPDHPLARALARPGHELQQRLATEEPTPEQLEVAEAALTACLRLEGVDHHA